MIGIAKRADRIGPVGSGLIRGRPGGKRFAHARRLARSAVLASALMLTFSPAKSAVTEYVVPSGPVITLQDGRAINGHVVRIDQTDIVIQSVEGVAETLPRSTVESVTFETITGETLVGELVGWTPGVYQIATSEVAIKVYSAMPAVAPEAEPATTIVEDEASQEEDVAANEEVVAAGQGDSQAIAAVSVDETDNGIDEGAVETAVGAQDAAITPTADLSIAVSVENSKENGPPVAFNIQLSEPSENSVVLIYATIDGTAVDGEDYEANRGVVVIKAGEQTARIEAAVIDDTELEQQEHLQLFLTVDPTVATVESRQIIATIDDDDQG